jgi:hypothetical protein
MTQDDCNNSRSRIHVRTENVQSLSGSGDVVTIEYDRIAFQGNVEKNLWDAALASADDALVLVQWLESKRSQED